MKYPIGPQSLAYFCGVKVNVSDKVVRDFRKKFQKSNPKSKPLQVFHDKNVINSNGLIPVVILERSIDADRALEALKLVSTNGTKIKKTTVKQPKRMNKKPTPKPKPMKSKPTKQTNAKKPSQKKQKPSRPMFVLPKLNKTEHSKKN